MAKMRSVVISLCLLAVAVAAAIMCVIWFLPGRSTSGPSGTTSSAATGISAVGYGISWAGLSVIVGVGLAVCLVLVACAVLLVSGVRRRRDDD